MEHSGFPSDETLAAFIDGRLDDVTRRRVVEHMTTCDECYAVYLAATEMQKASGAAPPRRHMMHRHFWAATLTISIAAVLTVGYFLRPQPHPGVDSLVAASRNLPYRTVEGRLSGFNSWKPLREVNRDVAAEAKHDAEKWELLYAAAKVEKSAKDDNSPESLHAVGVAHLLLGNFDEAIAKLQKAAEQRPADAEMKNDLANAYLARGMYKDQAVDYADAYELAAKAWSLKKTPEIAWTRALTLEHLHLPDARPAWNDYLALDPKSPWRDEAQKHLHGLGAPWGSDAHLWNLARPELERAAFDGDAATIGRIASQFPQQVAAFGAEQLLVRWAGKGDAKALDAAASIGDVIAPRGFGSLKATCSAIRGARCSTDTPVCEAMRQSIMELDRARTLTRNKDTDGAKAALISARALALRTGLPVAELAELELAVITFNQNDYDATNVHLDTAERELNARSWRSSADVLRARLNWLRGMVQFESGHPDDALRTYTTALSLANKTGHRDFQAALNALIAQPYEALGDAGAAWRYRVEALRLSARLGNSRRLQYVVFESTIAAVNEHRAALGDTLSRRMLNVATMQGGDFLEDAHIWRARALGGDDAVTELRNARLAAAQIPDGDARGRAIANIDMAAGDVLASALPREAIIHLTDALRFIDARGNHLLRAEAFGARARAYETSGQRKLASADRVAAIDEIETQRGQIDDPQQRAAFVRLARKLYNEEIDLAVASREYERAFDLAERSRATTAGVAPAMSIELLRRILPADVALVEYTALPRRTVAWIVRREGVTATILPSDGEAISAACERLIVARTDRRSFDVAAADVYSRVVAELRPRLAGVRTVAFVPDPSWTRVPFNALVDPATGHHLIEDMEVVTDASAAHFAAALQAAGPSRPIQRMLVCADPDAAGAPRLVAARREGALIGRTFDDASVISGADATREKFVAAAKWATLIHFAGHARNDAHNSDFSALLFSTDQQLYAWEIRKLKLTHTRLVVLAACDSGPISDAFLAAGASATIATLWDIGDARGRELMSKMYQRLHDGDSPSHALRTAQLAVLHDPGSRPADWAGYELVGL